MLFADLIIKGKYVLTMNAKPVVVRDGAVAIVGSAIKAVGKESEINAKYQAKNIINTGNSIVMPGFINTHTHAGMSYFRGMAEDMELDEWLGKHIWPAEAKYVNPDFIEKATELSVLEMIRAGVTTFNDMYFFADKVAEVANKAGIRAIVGEPIMNIATPSAKNADIAIEKTLKYLNDFKDNKLVKFSLAPHAIYTTDKEILKKVKDIAKDKNLLIHTHLTETKKEVDEVMKKHKISPVALFDVLGLLSDKFMGAHAVWLDDEDIEILKNNNVGVSHCPTSNMKLASGVARIEDMIKKGIRVGLATDSAVSNNTQELLTEIKIAALLQKSSNSNAVSLKAKQAVAMATGMAADIIGLGEETGSLKVGKKADIITIGLNKAHLLPVYDPYSVIAYAAEASDVDNVIIDGKIVMKNREVVTMDEERIIQEAREHVNHLARST